MCTATVYDINHRTARGTHSADAVDAHHQTYSERFAELFPIAYGASMRIVSDPVRSEDIAQEALARALVNWESIEDYAQPWVSRVATNLAIDEVRRRQCVPLDQVQVTVSDDTSRVEQSDELREALMCLPERQREAVVLRLVEGYSPEEAATAMGIGPTGVLKHTTRALRALRVHLGVPLPGTLAKAS